MVCGFMILNPPEQPGIQARILSVHLDAPFGGAVNGSAFSFHGVFND
jgi:hypothetical protein